MPSLRFFALFFCTLIFYFFLFEKVKQIETNIETKQKKQMSGDYVRKQDLTKHEATTCPDVQVDCPFKAYGCSEDILREDLQPHILECEFREETCVICSETYIFKNKNEHFNNVSKLGIHVCCFCLFIIFLNIFYFFFKNEMKSANLSECREIKQKIQKKKINK